MQVRKTKFYFHIINLAVETNMVLPMVLEFRKKMAVIAIALVKVLYNVLYKTKL